MPCNLSRHLHCLVSLLLMVHTGHSALQEPAIAASRTTKTAILSMIYTVLTITIDKFTPLAVHWSNKLPVVVISYTWQLNEYTLLKVHLHDNVCISLVLSQQACSVAIISLQNTHALLCSVASCKSTIVQKAATLKVVGIPHVYCILGHMTSYTLPVMYSGTPKCGHFWLYYTGSI